MTASNLVGQLCPHVPALPEDIPCGFSISTIFMLFKSPKHHGKAYRGAKLSLHQHGKACRGTNFSPNHRGTSLRGVPDVTPGMEPQIL